MVKDLSTPKWQAKQQSKLKLLIGILCFFLLIPVGIGIFFLGRTVAFGTELEISGNTIIVRKGGDFQAALNRAKPGDTIQLEAGATFRGNFTLPNKVGNEFITIRSSAPDSQLPPPDTRIDPQKYGSVFPKVMTINSEPAILATKGAHHYRFVAIEFASDSDKYVYNLVSLGADDAKIGEFPHHLEFDRVYLHPSSKGKTRRGFALNSAETLIKNSHISGFAYPEEETQAICGWFGPGPYKIINNYLEAGAENIMFGGGTPNVKGLVPSDIEVRGNYMTKPLEWRDKGGTKCNFELKNARRVTVVGNVMENSFYENAVRLTVRGESGHAPWATIEDVVLENNIIRNSGGGVNFLGKDDSGASVTMKRVKVLNNLFLGIDGNKWGGDGRFVTIADGESITIANNTVFQSGNLIQAHGSPTKGFVFRDNIASHNDYGFAGDDGIGKQVLTKYFADGVFSGNVIVNGKNIEKQYVVVPPRSYFATNFQSVGFVNLQGNDFRLAANSPFRGKGSNGVDPGVDFNAFDKLIGKKLP